MQEVALFSIPGCVSFPHTEVPLHVFEPRVERYPDDLRVQSEAEESTLKEKLIKRLQVLFADNKDALNYFSSEEIAQMSAEEFSFKVFSLVRFEPEIMQDVLEMKGAQDRLSFLLEGLNRL